MKPKINLLVLMSCVTLAQIGFTQDTPPAAAPANPAPAAQIEPVATPPPAPTNQAATIATTNPAGAPAVPIFPEVTASVTTNPAPAATESAPTNTATVATAPVATAAPAAATATNSNIIPLIQFVDVPLTAAIENLARQANLNYILDPKINFGQPGPDGRVAAAPSISIRWENLTAEQALNTILKTYDLQIIEDANSKIARIAAKDPAASEPLTTRVIQLKYASPSNIVAAAQSALTDKRSRVLPDVRTSQLVVVATEKEVIAVTDLIERLDTPTKQVLIESKILETTVNPKSVKGIDWTGTVKQQNVTFGNGHTTGNTSSARPGTAITTTDTLPGGRVITSTTSPGQDQQTILNTVLGNGGLTLDTLKGFNPQTAFLNADGVSIALSFLNNSADTKVISEPRTVTLDNQKSTIEVGLMYPIVNVSAGTANTSGGSSISYSNLTVSLDVTPRITANNFVELKVQQSVLRLGPQFSSTVGDKQNTVDSFFTRKLETDVLIPSGNTLVMGGLVSDENTTANAKVPLLGDLPFFGLAFRKDTKARNRQNLIIFITPTIVEDSDFKPAQSTFLQSTGNESVQEGLSAWDSGKPYDWSKLSRKKSAANQ